MSSDSPRGISYKVRTFTRSMALQAMTVSVWAPFGSAIVKTLSSAEAGDVILIAGKGHENYQILGKEKIHFSDQEVVRDYFRNSST